MKLNNKKGISLIVLVITIIVMIVLAAAIILSLSSSGVIGRANEAKSKSDIANAKQVVAMATAEWQLYEEKIKSENPGITTFKEYANKKLQEAGYSVSGNGGIDISDTGAVNTIYIDSKGKQAIIPEGFKVSSVSTEKIVEDGLVIKDENGNEFVWVPVEVPDGKTFQEVFVKKYFTGNSIGIEPYSTDTYTEEVEEYNKMKESVKKHGGFYIARYEAGLPEGKTTSTVTASDIPVSKKGTDAWNRLPWGTDMTTIGTEGAVYRARQMYKDSNSVVSTLCYGVQWDAVMNFMKDVPNPNVSGENYVDNSIRMGWYMDNSSSTLIYTTPNPEHKTGIDVDEKASNMVKNIYDMAGNQWEWTMEATEGGARYARGGDWCEDGTSVPASYRFTAPAEGTSGIFGFRSALYLK